MCRAASIRMLGVPCAVRLDNFQEGVSMKARNICAGAVLTASVAFPMTGQASAIFIDESVEGPPVVTYSSPAIVGSTVFRDLNAVSPGSESWVVRVFFAGTTVGADVGQSGVELIDPVSGLPSDLAPFFNLDSTSHLPGSNPGNSFVEIGVYSTDDT